MSAPTLKECYGSPHMMGTKVPKGGSHCGNCIFLNEKPDGPHCTNACWVDTPEDRGGGDGHTRIPVKDPSTYCCDMWEKAIFTKAVKNQLNMETVKALKK
jgi:hypothetical protein